MPEVICKVCDKPFMANRTTKKYCSWECFHIHDKPQKAEEPPKRLYSRKSDPARNIFAKVKKTMDINECAECRETGRLCVHHKDKNKFNNMIGNLIVLCYSCHREKHPELPDKFFI